MSRQSWLRIGATALALLSGPGVAMCEPLVSVSQTASPQTFGPFLTAILGRSFSVNRADGRSSPQSAVRIAPNTVLFLGFKITMIGDNAAYATAVQDPDQVYWPVKFTEKSMMISSLDEKISSTYSIDDRGDLNWKSVNAYFADAQTSGVYRWSDVQEARLRIAGQPR